MPRTRDEFSEMVGAQLLDEVAGFTSRFVAYPSEHAHVAHVLWAAHAHFMAVLETTPRLAFLSPEPGSGKSRALEITGTLVPRAVQAINVTPAYLFRKVGDEDGLPTIMFDEIDTVFGPKAKDNEEIRALLNAGYHRGAVAGRCVVKGKSVETEEIPAFCAVALAGIGSLPDTILTRSIVVKMRRRAPNETVEPYRRRLHAPQGETLAARLSEFAAMVGDDVEGAFPELPEGINDRDADVWEPLIAVADAAGGQWPEKARVAAVALVADSKESTPSLGLKLLSDLRTVFQWDEQLPTQMVLDRLVELEESPWADLKGKPLDPRRLSRLLGDYDIKSTTIRVGTTTPKGYRRADLQDAWDRYLGAPPEKSATSATAATGDDDDWIPPGWE